MPGKKYVLTLAYGTLSEAEVEAYLTNLNLNYRVVGRVGRCLILEAEEISPQIWSGLAGIHKVAEVFAEVSGAEELKLDLLADSASDKMRWAVSTYSDSRDSAEDFAEALQRRLKEAFKAWGVRKTKMLRGELYNVGSSWEYEVFSQRLQEERVVEEGLEVLAVEHRNWLIGRTIAVVDHLGYRRRDLVRPIQDPKITIPPKLARILVNLTGCRRGDTLLDPFCGLGTILAEAVMCGVNVIGVDADAGRVEGARRNLRWLMEQHKIDGVKVEIYVGYAEKLHKILKDRFVDGVATEPILLPPLKQPPPDQEAERLLEKAGETYYKGLPSISKHLKPEGRAAIVIPCVKTRSRRVLSFDLAAEASRFGLRLCRLTSVEKFPILVEDPTQMVMRGVYLFKKAEKLSFT
jgi:tRNA G10  N-methylase Trm11